VLSVLIKFIVDVAFNIVTISLLSSGSFSYENMNTFDLVAWLLVTGFARGL